MQGEVGATAAKWEPQPERLISSEHGMFEEEGCEDVTEVRTPQLESSKMCPSLDAEWTKR